jgi:hypothetical protein
VGIVSLGFHDTAEVETTAAFRALIAQVAERALGELEALRVSLDVRYEAVAAALTDPATIDPEALRGVIDQLADAASRDAETAAREARNQALKEAQDRLDIERTKADERLRQVQLEAAAQREVDQSAHASLTMALGQASAELEAVRARALAQLEAASDAQTQLLEETHAQLEAAHLESERALAAKLADIEELRAELDKAQAENARAAAETDKIEQAAEARLAAVRAEFEANMQSEATARAALTAALEEARAELDEARTRSAALVATAEAARLEAQTAIEAARRKDAALQEVAEWDKRVPRPIPRSEEPLGPTTSDPRLDRLSAALHAIDAATNLPHLFDALLEGVSTWFPRAAVFVVRAEQLQGWRSIGFEGASAITQEFKSPLAFDSVLTRAVNTGHTVVTGGDRADRGQGAAEHEVWTVTLPVSVGSRVAAVVFGDEGERPAGSAPSCDRRMAIGLGDMLARQAGRRLTELTSTPRTAPGSIAPAPAKAPGTSVAPLARDASTERVRPEEPRGHDDAKRYARLLVSEIKRYQEASVLAGVPDARLYERLKVEIERCRRLYAKRMPLEGGATLNCFDEALAEMLGGAAVAGGPLNETAGGSPTDAAFEEPRAQEQPLSVRT